jgi:hypothetical protein
VARRIVIAQPAQEDGPKGRGVFGPRNPRSAERTLSAAGGQYSLRLMTVFLAPAPESIRAVALAGAGSLHQYAHAPHRIQVGLLVLLVGMLVVGGWVASSGRNVLGPALAFLPFALAWLNLDEQIEGRVLVTFGVAHGIVEADLVPFVIAVLAAGGWRLQDQGHSPALGPRHRL